MPKITKLLMLPLICGLLVFFAACSNNGEATGASTKVSITSSIPANSGVVLHLNLGQLMEKADYNTVKETTMFKDAVEDMKKENPSMVPFLEDPASAGINIEGDVALVMNFEESITKQKVVAIWPVADKAKVLEALKQAAEGNETPKIEEREGYTLFAIREKECVAIGDKVMAIMSNDDDVTIKSIINPTGEGIKSNASFAKHYNEGKDMMFWMNTTPVAKAGLKQNPMVGMGLGMAQVTPQNLEENYMAFYYDFKNGEADAGGHFDFNKELKGKFSSLFMDEMTTDYSKVLPSDNLVMAGTFALNPNEIVSYLGNTGLANVVERQIESSRLNLGDLKEMLVGDIAGALYAGTSPAFLMAVGLKDAAKMDKYITSTGLPKDGDVWSIAADGITYTAKIANNQLLIASSKELLAAAEAGGSNATVAELQEGWMGMYIDYEVLAANKESIDKAFDGRFSDMSLENMEDFKNLKFVFDGPDMSGKMYLKNKNENAIKTMIKMAEKSYIENKNRKDEFDDFDDAFGGESKEL